MGRAVARKIQKLKGRKPIIVALKPSSLTAAVAAATHLHGFVQPFITEPVYIESYKIPIGVVDQSNNFVYNPKLSSSEVFDIENNYGGFIESEKLRALQAVNKFRSALSELSYDVENREVVLFADVLQGVMELDAASRLFNEGIARETVVAVGNVTSAVSDYLRENIKEEFYFLHSIKDVFDDNHYFDNPAEYTIEQLGEIMANIKRYWK